MLGLFALWESSCFSLTSWSVPFSASANTTSSGMKAWVTLGKKFVAAVAKATQRPLSLMMRGRANGVQVESRSPGAPSGVRDRSFTPPAMSRRKTSVLVPVSVTAGSRFWASETKAT